MQIESLEMQAAAALQKAKTLNCSSDTGPDQPSLGTLLGIFRDAVLAILAVIAKQEHVRKPERAQAAIARLRRQGQADKLGRPRTEPLQARQGAEAAGAGLELAGHRG